MTPGRLPGPLAGRRLVHLATTDMSLALLLGPQLRAFADAGMEVIGASAAGAYADELAAWGIRHEPVQHATRSNSVGEDVQALAELVRMFRRLRPDIVHTHNPKPGVYGRLAARLAGVPVVVNTVHGLYATPDDPPPTPDVGLRTRTHSLRLLAGRAGAERGGHGDAGPPAGPGSASWFCWATESTSSAFDHTGRVGRGGAAIDGREPTGGCSSGWSGGSSGRRGLPSSSRRPAGCDSTSPEVAIVVIGPSDPAKSNALSEDDVRAAEEIGNVSFLGERKDVEDLYPGMDLFVLPSYREGFPARPWRRRPVACRWWPPTSAAAARSSTTASTGLLVPVRDGAALADALDTLARDPARRRAMSEASVARAKRRVR